jgi:hypothetical protein
MHRVLLLNTPLCASQPLALAKASAYRCPGQETMQAAPPTLGLAPGQSRQMSPYPCSTSRFMNIQRNP